MAPPDPIPNSAVKRISANNSDYASDREDRSRLGDCGAVFLVENITYSFLNRTTIFLKIVDNFFLILEPKKGIINVMKQAENTFKSINVKFIGNDKFIVGETNICGDLTELSCRCKLVSSLHLLKLNL